jgi:hypothetical protein
MARSKDSRGPIGALDVGSELAGLELCRLIAGDEFSTLWLTAPLDEGFADSCIRAIPAYNLRSPDAFQRLRSELSFWRDLSGRCAVNLYECGKSGAYYFLQMRYMPDGSAADQLEEDEWLRDHLTDFAVAFAAVLRDVHADSGAHGNLKPTNVFPVRNQGVLLSDFAISLWFDELAAGSEVIQPRLLHPYRAPEQRQEPRDFDTRSDVYAFGLILLRCLSGEDPAPDGELPDRKELDWPEGLGRVVDRCLARDREDRPADGFELFETLGRSTRYVRPVRRERRTAEQEERSSGVETYAGGGEGEVQRLIARARQMVEEGLLDEAVQVLESLPAGTEGAADLIDEVDRRCSECQQLTEEAVRLAGLGNHAAASELVKEAEGRWPHSRTLIAVKADLMAAAQEAPTSEGGIPGPLGTALEAGRYAAARTTLEKLIREGAVNDELRRAIREFKKGRVRRAFLDNINTARRLYVLGHREEAAEHWLEAARWLPQGSDREKLRRIAGEARRGRLQLDVEDAAVAAAARPLEAAPAEPVARPQRPAWSRRKWRLFLIAAGVLAFLLVGGATLIWGLLGD